jgi:glycosyltransferase involved in cell wall biosynthesis
MVNKPLLSIVIPCLNERETISLSIKDALHCGRKYFGGNFELIVADNGSTDGSLEIIKRFKKVNLVVVPIRGYGAALHWGTMNAKGKYIVFADADLSYPFSNLKKFKKVLMKSPDLLLGSRIKGKIRKGAMPFLHRYLGTPVLTFLIRLIYKIPTTDCNSGMRVIKRSFYRKLNMRNSGMEWASELLLKTALKKGKYIEVPILFKKDERTKPPHLSTWSDGWRHLKSIVLLKPSSLYPFLLIFPAIAFYFYKSSFGFTFLFINLTIVLFLSLLTLQLLGSVIEGKETKFSEFLKEFKLVPYVGVFSIFVGVVIYVIPDEHLGTKLLLASILGIVFMWIFLIETIKTHLANRLPDL